MFVPDVKYQLEDLRDTFVNDSFFVIKVVQLI